MGLMPWASVGAGVAVTLLVKWAVRRRGCRHPAPRRILDTPTRRIDLCDVCGCSRSQDEHGATKWIFIPHDELWAEVDFERDLHAFAFPGKGMQL